MWSDVKAMGTSNKFLRPDLANPLMASSVWGPSHGRGPTYNGHIHHDRGKRDKKTRIKGEMEK